MLYSLIEYFTVNRFAVEAQLYGHRGLEFFILFVGVNVFMSGIKGG